MNKLQKAEQFRRAVQLFVDTLNDEQALEVATMFDEWRPGVVYTAKARLFYGANSVGDPQLYTVSQDHTSQEGWTPDVTAALYTPLGLDDNGYPVWSQPTGAHDAYNTGDVVNYNGTLYKSTVDGNVYAPDVYPGGWATYSG